MGNATISAPKSKFDDKIEPSSAKMYFHYYGQLLHQQNMLQDYVRTGQANYPTIILYYFFLNVMCFWEIWQWKLNLLLYECFFYEVKYYYFIQYERGQYLSYKNMGNEVTNLSHCHEGLKCTCLGIEVQSWGTLRHASTYRIIRQIQVWILPITQLKLIKIGKRRRGGSKT